MNKNVVQSFSLEGRVIVITGGAGLLGNKHAEAVAEAGGIPVLVDINQESLATVARKIKKDHNVHVLGLRCDITSKSKVSQCLETIIERFGHLDGLINNAANDPKVGPGTDANKLARFENLSEDIWNADISVGLTGAFLCAQVFGHYMATHGGGVIVNIASDLAVIAPDQRIYQVPAKPYIHLS